MSAAFPTQAVPVAVLIVAYNGRQFLEECLASLLADQDARLDVQIVVVDNGSTDDTSAYLATLSMPGTHVVVSQENLGFAGGNNLGWEWILARLPDVRHVCLLNQDTQVEPGWLWPLVEQLETKPDVGCVQAKLLLYPDTTLINTLGNRSHYLGFGLLTAYRQPDRPDDLTPRSIDYPSGAAVLVRCAALEGATLFDPQLFMYLEDAELGWKLRQTGYESVVAPASRVYHKYRFKQGYEFYYHLERNRLWLLLVYYRWRTIWLLLPAIVFMECGQLAFAWSIGRLTDKLRSYAFFCRRPNIMRLLAARRVAQTRRRLGDKQTMTRFAGKIESSELTSPLLRYVGNPLLNAYWQIARRLIAW